MTRELSAKELRTLLEQVLKEFCTAHGLRRHGRTWYRMLDETLVGIALQGSQFGPQFYCNLHVRFNALGVIAHPKRGEWHINLRLDDLAPNRFDQIVALLDGSAPIDDSTRQREFRDLLDIAVEPFLARTTTVEEVRALRESASLKGADVVPAAEDLLKSRPPRIKV